MPPTVDQVTRPQDRCICQTSPLSRLPRAAGPAYSPSLYLCIGPFTRSGDNSRLSGTKISRGVQKTVKGASKRGTPRRDRRRGVCVRRRDVMVKLLRPVIFSRWTCQEIPGDSLVSPFGSGSVRERGNGVAHMETEAASLGTDRPPAIPAAARHRVAASGAACRPRSNAR